ncbi:AAA domain-containing protein [Nguyenibacter vanlangensis]|uniref:AAA domain-containing protein n=1 Tax=Nguyenibacter vanlangensis TaxID=1216886 RepID=A0ABZ3D9H4_9PROT
MSVTPDTVRRVLRSWIALEVLTPQATRESGWNDLAADREGRIRNRRTDATDGPDLWQPPHPVDPTPWPILPDPPEPPIASLESDSKRPSEPQIPQKERPKRRWYNVILGAMPTRKSFERLNAAIGENDPDEEDKTDRSTMKGNVIAASLVLDEWGIMVPDTLAIASFAWGVGHILGGGGPTGLAEWDREAEDLRSRFADLLTPRGGGGKLRSLTWADLHGVAAKLAEALSVPADLWIPVPCAIESEKVNAPNGDLLSSFYLPDLGRALRDAASLPSALAAYLGLTPPAAPWDALTDRTRLAELLSPDLFPLGRWPGPGLHPLTLLQQAAVNAVTRDLATEGLAAINGPPGTGKTTLLRDLVAQVMVARAEKLADIETPSDGVGDLDLMDFAVVVASSNNAAVENISLELPVREKALDDSVWRDEGLDHFGHTATHLLGLKQDAEPAKRAWGLIAARLGNMKNRQTFFDRFWRDEDWGLDDWLNRAGWPNTQNRKGRKPGKLSIIDPPLRYPEAMARWREAKDTFHQALARSRRLRDELVALSRTGDALRKAETELPQASETREQCRLDHEGALRAAAVARSQVGEAERLEGLETTKLSALTSVRPSFLSKMLRTQAWQAHESGIREQIARLDEAQRATRDARMRREAAIAEDERRGKCYADAEARLETLLAEAARFGQQLEDGRRELGDSFPGPGFWAQPDDLFQKGSPWNGGRFRRARDELFVAAIRLHRAFVAAGPRPLKTALNTVVSGSANASAQDWGYFFLLVPVVSTTFASIGRMFHTFRDASIGWLLIDEAGQATPQQAVGAIWRARRAVVIGDPLQIEPVVTTPEHTTALIFRGNGLTTEPWAAPEVSAQVLADRASVIQGRFPIGNPVSEGPTTRDTGMPLLVHRRCEKPMFDLANRIAYASRMVHATGAGRSAIRDRLGPSAWINMDAPSNGKWVEAEGRLIAETIVELCRLQPQGPDLYVISPFRIPATCLKQLLGRTSGFLPELNRTDREKWIERHIGTVHTFQGKEAEAVILMLGAGRGARPGSRTWAGGTPNLLNVAATRAKRVLYIIGNHEEWRGAGFFSHAAQAFPVVAPDEWIEQKSVSAAS